MNAEFPRRNLWHSLFDDTDLRGIPGFADQSAFAATEVSKAEEVAQDREATVDIAGGAFIEPYRVVQINSEDWNIYDITTAIEVNCMDLRVKFWFLQEKRRSDSGEVLSTILAGVALAEQSLELERQKATTEADLGGSGA